MRPISGFDKYLSKVTCANFGDFLQKRTFKTLRQRTIRQLLAEQNCNVIVFFRLLYCKYLNFINCFKSDYKYALLLNVRINDNTVTHE